MALTQVKSKWISAVSVSVLCAVAIGGCSKKDNDNTAQQPEDALQTQTVPAETLLPCDDATAVNSLSRSIKGLVAEQARAEMADYAAKIGTDVDNSVINGLINNIIIDVGTPKKLDSTNSNGMQTCQASLSVTLPSENIYLANEVYAGVDGQNMQQMLAASNVRLNSNMLVDDAFTYVVGMQGGQARAKIAGHPAVIQAVADIMAKSQLKELMSKTRSISQPARPLAPPAPRPVPTIRTPAEPRVQNDTLNQNRESSRTVRSDNSRTVLPNNDRAQELNDKVDNVRNPITSNVQDESLARTLDENRNAVKPLAKNNPVVKSDQPLSVPTDDSMDMVIIEEDATY